MPPLKRYYTNETKLSNNSLLSQNPFYVLSETYEERKIILSRKKEKLCKSCVDINNFTNIYICTQCTIYDIFDKHLTSTSQIYIYYFSSCYDTRRHIRVYIKDQCHEFDMLDQATIDTATVDKSMVLDFLKNRYKQHKTKIYKGRVYICVIPRIEYINFVTSKILYSHYTAFPTDIVNLIMSYLTLQ